MPTQTIHFDASGGALSVRLRAAAAWTGSYAVFLKEHNNIAIVQYWDGDFAASGDTTIKLPQNLPTLDGRILIFVASVGIVDEDGIPIASMKIVQDGEVIGTALCPDSKKADTQTGEVDVVLSSSPSTGVANASLLLLARKTMVGKGSVARERALRALVASRARKAVRGTRQR